MLRALRLGVMVFIVGAVLPSAVARASVPRATRVYTANCGTVGFLEYEPTLWSAGCTSGSPEVAHARWSSWTSESARAHGDSYVENCSPSCAQPSRHAFYQSSVVLSDPARCGSGAPLEFFSRAVLTVTYPRGNPFGMKPGPHVATSRPLSHDTECQRA